MSDASPSRTQPRPPDVERAYKQLDLVLSFFDRCESRLSLVFGSNVAMVGLLAAASPPWHRLQPYMLLAAIPLFLLILSTFHVYFGLFPHVDGPARSVVFFGRIGSMSRDQFDSAWRATSVEELEHEVLDQVWRNAEILNRKFARLRSAFSYTALAVLPWAASFAVLLWADEGAKSIIGR